MATSAADDWMRNLDLADKEKTSSANPPATKREPAESSAAMVELVNEKGKRTIKVEKKNAIPPRRGIGTVLIFLSKSGVSIAPTFLHRGIVMGVKM